MANRYNPYGIASTQQGLLESLLGSEQAQKTGALAFGQQKGEMSEEFQKEQIASQRKQKELLNQKRETKGFGGFLETIAPMLGLIPGVGTIAGATLAGLSGMYKAKQQSKFAQQQIEAAKGAGLDAGKWGGTFLGKESGRIAAGNESMLDDMLEATKVSGGDLFKTGLTEGIKGYAMGKMGEGIGKTFGEAKAGDLVKGSDVRAIEKAGLDKFKLEGLGEVYGDEFGKMADIDFSQMSNEELNKIRDLGKTLGIEKGEFGSALDGSAFDVDAIDPSKQFLTDTLNKALGMQGKQTLIQSLFGTEALGRDPSTLFGDESEAEQVMKNLLLMLQMGGGR